MSFSRSWNRWTLTAGIGVLALTLLMLSWPAFRASFRYLPVEMAVQSYYSTREIPSERLSVLIRYAEEAVGYHDHYRFHDGLSLLHQLRAIDAYTPAMDRLGAYQEAAREAQLSLQRAPSQPSIWLRLATIRWILHEEAEDILAAWKMSVFTGRTETTLLGPRVETGLAFREYLDEEGVSLLRDQLLLAWKVRPGSLVGVLSRRDPNLLLTRPLIQLTDPAALEEMEAWLAKLP